MNSPSADKENADPRTQFMRKFGDGAGERRGLAVRMPRSTIPKASPKDVLKRWKGWSFHMPRGEAPVFVYPMKYLAFGENEDGSFDGVVHFKHQITRPEKRLPYVQKLVGLPGHAIQSAIATLREDYKDDLKEEGTRPMTQAEAAPHRLFTFNDAMEAVKDGRMSDIPHSVFKVHHQAIMNMFNIVNASK